MYSSITTGRAEQKDDERNRSKSKIFSDQIKWLNQLIHRPAEDFVPKDNANQQRLSVKFPFIWTIYSALL
jgi:hypothetical protein